MMTFELQAAQGIAQDCYPWEAKGLSSISLVGSGVSMYPIGMQDKLQQLISEAGLFTTGLYDSTVELEENLRVSGRILGSVVVLDTVGTRADDYSDSMTAEVPDMLHTYGYTPYLSLVRFARITPAEEMRFLSRGYDDVIGYELGRENHVPLLAVANAISRLKSHTVASS